MKTVLMIMLLLGGFAIQQADAQNCCLPCPPGCCIKSCSAKGSAAAASTTDQTIEATFASFILASTEPACQPKCVAAADAKSTPTACKSSVMPSLTCKKSTAVAAAPSGSIPTASVTTRVKEKS